VAIAKEAGFSISADDLTNKAQSVELSDEELEGVAGAVGCTAPKHGFLDWLRCSLADGSTDKLLC